MAGPGVSSPGGFSYAQAAKGRVATPTSQAPSKLTSGAATPATDILADFAPAASSNWADDEDLAVADKLPQSSEEPQEKSKAMEPKSVIERAKAEEKAQTTSGVSSPDLAASATSNDDASSANNGSSQTSWDAKSQASETPAATEGPASGSWIAARAERAERQSDTRHKHESSGGKSKKNKAEKTEEAPAPPPKPVVLTEAPAPTVNPWAKLAEAQKAKQAAAPQPAPKHTQAPGPAANLKENQRPRADSKKKGNSANTSTDANDSKKPGSSQGKRSDVAARQAAKPAASIQRAEVNVPGYSRPVARDERPNAAAPPPVKDDVSWPTPDTAPVVETKERKPVVEKDSEEKNDESVSTGKSRKKQEWKVVPVVPNVLWETPVMREKSARSTLPGGEGRGRGGSTIRGRGNFRAAANSTTARSGAQGGDETRQGRSEVSEDATAKAQRSASVSSQSRSTIKPAAQQDKDTSAADAKPSMPRTNKSKVDGNGFDGQEAEFVPGSAPRGPKAEEIDGAAQGREGQAGRPAAGLEKSNAREGNWNSTRGGARRGGRGRGGSREFANGHHGAQPFANANAGPDFSGVSPFGVPQSPSFQASRGNHFAGPGRAGFRGNSRAQSFPVENVYNRYPPFPNHMHGYGQGTFEYNGYPMPSVPYSTLMDQSYLFGVVAMQLEYYFSLDNLLKDMYLRKNMDSQGFVYLEVLASFNRVKNLTQDWELLKQVCLQSDIVQIRIGEDGKERVRKRGDYQQFVLPMEERFPAARHEGPTKLDVPEQRVPANMYAPMQMMQMNPHGVMPHPSAMPRQNERRDNTHAMMNGAARGAFFPQNPEGSYGEEMRGRAQKPAIFDNSVHQAYLNTGDTDTEPDVFPEHKLEQLTVCVRLSSRRVPYHTAAARTYSNGSIDQKSIAGDIGKQDGQAANGEALTNATASPTQSRGTSPSVATSPERSAGGHVFWIKDTEHPVGTLPSDLTPEPYVQLRLKALEQRSHAATGTCPYDLRVLYQFWSHFLVRNFNNRMYSEFKYYADADAKERVSLEGQKNLVKYYIEAVKSANPLPTRVVKDYIELVKSEGPSPESTLFTSLQAAWSNKALNLRNRKTLADCIDQDLKSQLEG